jgi:hypothetical protein
MPALQLSLESAVTLPGPGEREINPRLDDDLKQPSTATRTVLGQPRVQITGVTEVVTRMPVGLLEVK